MTGFRPERYPVYGTRQAEPGLVRAEADPEPFEPGSGTTQMGVIG